MKEGRDDKRNGKAKTASVVHSSLSNEPKQKKNRDVTRRLRTEVASKKESKRAAIEERIDDPPSCYKID